MEGTDRQNWLDLKCIDGAIRSAYTGQEAVGTGIRQEDVAELDEAEGSGGIVSLVSEVAGRYTSAADGCRRRVLLDGGSLRSWGLGICIRLAAAGVLGAET